MVFESRGVRFEFKMMIVQYVLNTWKQTNNVSSKVI
jgi:hypothetical protein